MMGLSGLALSPFFFVFRFRSIIFATIFLFALAFVVTNATFFLAAILFIIPILLPIVAPVFASVISHDQVVVVARESDIANVIAREYGATQESRNYYRQ